MNVIEKIMQKRHRAEMTLGNPPGDEAAIERRMNFYATLRNGNGFRQPPKSARPPKKNAQGKTRRMRRLEAFTRAFRSKTP